MAKSSVLTPVLAGVLGVAVVGSGVAYYNVYVKDGGKNAEKDAKNTKTSAVLSVDQAADNIQASLDTAQKIAKGDMNTGYKGTVSYTPPSGGEIGQLGIKSVSVGAEVKQKDKMSGMDYTFAYDSKDLLTLNIVFDNDNETGYIKIPELSDAYLYGTTEEIEEWMQSQSNSLGAFGQNNYGGSYDFDSDDYDFDDGDYDFGDFDFDESAYTSGGSMDVGSALTSVPAAPDFEKLEGIDFEALFEDLEGYADVVKENAPEGTDAEDYTVTNGGESITLTTKRYTITGEDVEKVFNAVMDKAKDDSALKELMAAMGVDESQYQEMWSSMADGMDTSESDDTMVLDVYYNGDEVQGLKATSDSEPDEQIYFVVASDEDKLIVDIDTNADDGQFKADGLVKVNDDTLDGSINFSSDDGAKMTVTFDGLTSTDDSVNGSMKLSGDMGERGTYDVTFTFDCKEGSGDITVSGSVAGEDIGVLNINTTQTDASDITVPGGQGYKLTDEAELQKYLETCDSDKFMNSVKDAVGEELYNQLFGSAASLTEGGMSGSTDQGSTFSSGTTDGNDLFITDDDGIGA